VEADLAETRAGDPAAHITRRSVPRERPS
jgi:hypothetical protein